MQDPQSCRVPQSAHGIQAGNLKNQPVHDDIALLDWFRRNGSCHQSLAGHRLVPFARTEKFRVSSLRIIHMLRITDWPTRLLRVRHQDAEWDAHLDLVALPVGIPTSPGVILEGNTDDAMKSLISDGRNFAAICVDFPHFASLDTASRLGRQTVSISIAKQIFGDACQTLQSDGRIIVLADCWAAPWVLVALEDCGSLRLDQITCWQKRYSGLQDKRGQVDSSFDLIFEVVHAAGGTHSAPKIELLAEGAGTRSEDATKEEAALKERGVYGSQVSPSKQAKPLRLCTQLLARSPNGPILELFSDSGYFAAAAAAVAWLVAMGVGTAILVGFLVTSAGKDLPAYWARLAALIGGGA